MLCSTPTQSSPISPYQDVIFCTHSLSNKRKFTAGQISDEKLSKRQHTDVLSNDTVTVKNTYNPLCSAINTDFNENETHTISEDKSHEESLDLFYLESPKQKRQMSSLNSATGATEYSVCVLVDNREIKKGSNRNIYYKLRERNIWCEKRNLQLGDVMWLAIRYRSSSATSSSRARQIANSSFESSDDSDCENSLPLSRPSNRSIKNKNQSLRDEDEEIVMNYILERKRIPDLRLSLVDGRYKEQKFRLQRCGVENVIYLIEGIQQDVDFNDHFTQILTELQISDNFYLIRTKSEDETVNYLMALTRELQTLLNNSYSSNTPKKEHKLKLKTELTFEQFNEKVSKTRNLCLTDIFAKQLMQIRGVSAEKAAAIVSVYRTPHDLIKAYDEVVEEQEKNELLCNIRWGKSQRRLGRTLSARIARFYNDFGNGSTPLTTKTNNDTNA
jgi:ERCC4-type nuclease